ncbi:MAG: hypothetical protein WA728_09080 [Xanthobacteraceae bacterium]
MLDRPAQLPTHEEILPAISKSFSRFHLASSQMRKATTASYGAILESKELLARTDKVLSRIKDRLYYEEEPRRRWRPTQQSRGAAD